MKVCGTRIENTTSFKDTKLQTLDRRVGNDQLFFDREMFAKSLDAWEGIPVIYHAQGVHPSDFDAVNENPTKAAKDIGGKFVGRVSNPRIVIPGGARLMAQLDIEQNEDEIVRLWEEGKLFPSTAFSVFSDGDRITSPPIPNHVLLFPIEVDKVVPGDFGAFVNTLEVQTMKTDTETEESFIQRVKHALEVLKGTPEVKTPEETPMIQTPEVLNTEAVPAPSASVIPEPVAPVEAETAPAVMEDTPAEVKVEAEEQPAAEPTEAEAVTEESPAPVETKVELNEKDAEIEALKQELESLKHTASELEAVKAELSALKEKSANDKFDALVHSLPVGMTATQEQRDALRKEFDAGNMEGLLFTVLQHTNTAGNGVTAKEGTPYMHTESLESIGVGDLCGK